MARVRNEVALLKDTLNVHGRLILNYDQVWEMKHRGPRGTLFKKPEFAGECSELPGGSVALFKTVAKQAQAPLVQSTALRIVLCFDWCLALL